MYVYLQCMFLSSMKNNLQITELELIVNQISLNQLEWLMHFGSRIGQEGEKQAKINEARDEPIGWGIHYDPLMSQKKAPKKHP